MTRYRIRDNVTYSRNWVVEAATEEEALTKANNEGPPGDETYQEEQINSTAYEVEEVAEAEEVAKKLPPDPDDMNDERAEWAGAALDTFQQVTKTDNEDLLPDLLADLLHWCDRHDTSFDKALARARMHYEAETAGEVA